LGRARPDQRGKPWRVALQLGGLNFADIDIGGIDAAPEYRLQFDLPLRGVLTTLLDLLEDCGHLELRLDDVLRERLADSVARLGYLLDLREFIACIVDDPERLPDKEQLEVRLPHF